MSTSGTSDRRLSSQGVDMGMSQLLFIVARGQRERFESLKGSLAGSQHAHVVADRRFNQRRGENRPVSQDRRRRQERRHIDITWSLRALGWAVVERHELSPGDEE